MTDNLTLLAALRLARSLIPYTRSNGIIAECKLCSGKAVPVDGPARAINHTDDCHLVRIDAAISAYESRSQSGVTDEYLREVLAEECNSYWGTEFTGQNIHEAEEIQITPILAFGRRVSQPPADGRDDGWRPIERAPKGVDIIGLFPDGAVRGMWYFAPSSKTFGWCAVGLKAHKGKPTHWIPRPPNPNQEPG